jgi:hypothetical protein
VVIIQNEFATAAMKKGHTLFKPLLDEFATPENMLFPSRFLDKPHREQVSK